MFDIRILLKVLSALLFVTSLLAVGLAYLILIAHGHSLSNDFSVFYLAGQLLGDGKQAVLYAPAPLKHLEQTMQNMPHFSLPWSYPPQYDLVALVLAKAQIQSAYMSFIGLGYAAWLVILRILARERLYAVFAMIFPTTLILAISGQNGFVTASLAGLFAILCLRDSWAAGIPLGLLIIKPQFGLALALYVLVSRRWGGVLAAVLTIVLSSILATLVFGAGIWPLFLAAAGRASHGLMEGIYATHRMTSLFASLYSLGVPAFWAMCAQVAAALTLAGMIVHLQVASRDARLVLGLSVSAVLMFTPYGFDYDFAIFGVGLALLAPAISRQATPAEKALLFALTWVAAGTGISERILMFGAPLRQILLADHTKPTFAGLAYLSALGLLFVIARRAAQSPGHRQHEGPDPAGPRPVAEVMPGPA